MPNYLQQVKAQLATHNAERKVRKQEVDTARADSWRDQMRPLKDRLADLLSTIPEEVKRVGVSLSDLQVQLRGRKGNKAHCGEVATALRQLGFRRARIWRQAADTGFTAKWKRS